MPSPHDVLMPTDVANQVQTAGRHAQDAAINPDPMKAWPAPHSSRSAIIRVAVAIKSPWTTEVIAGFSAKIGSLPPATEETPCCSPPMLVLVLHAPTSVLGTYRKTREHQTAGNGDLHRQG